MRITALGAAGEVTGSGYLVETRGARVLVDYGMFQGRGSSDEKNAELGPLRPDRLDAVVLTHAHLDHCGRLPLLRGLRCKIHMTEPTCELAEVILLDSAHIQESDAQRENTWRERTGEEPTAKPLYTAAEVKPIVERFVGMPYGEAREIAPGITIVLHDAGHILGSASVEMRVQEEGRTKTVVFSGDVGQSNMPILRDPSPCVPADLVVLESTYGDRDHRPSAQTLAELKEILKKAAWEKQKVLCPAFAIGRTQLLLYVLAEIVRDGTTPSVPIYLDSPLAIRATEIYSRYPHEFDDHSQKLARTGEARRALSNLSYCSTPAESRALNEIWGASVVIAGSGMCDGGRIMHHLRHNLWRRGVQVLLTSYMAEGTLGRKLVDHAPKVRIFREDVVVRADVHTVNGLSAHAGQSGLVAWAAPALRAGARVVLTHGENPQRAALRAKLEKDFKTEVQTPMRFEVMEL
ncbi:MAG: MBL fold metallo-hydrolase [Phycisphaerales bacterium]